MTWPGIGACGFTDPSIGYKVVCERALGHPGYHVGWITENGLCHTWKDATPDTYTTTCVHCAKEIWTRDYLRRHWVHTATNDYDCHLGATP